MNLKVAVKLQFQIMLFEIQTDPKRLSQPFPQQIQRSLLLSGLKPAPHHY